MASPPLLGPIALCTLVAADGAALVAVQNRVPGSRVARPGSTKCRSVTRICGDAADVVMPPPRRV